MPRVNVPPAFRGPTRGEARVPVEGSTVAECIEALSERYPGFREQIFDARGNVHRFVQLFVNGDEIERGGLEVALAPEDEVEILAAVAGGCSGDGVGEHTFSPAADRQDPEGFPWLDRPATD